jgi:predicted ATPase/DNA-binding NarL/FixJ family response regulator/DNA-binding XRE family transcriptional regulator
VDNRARVSSDVLAARLRHLRVRLGLSQEQLAHRLGVTFATVNRWENGHTRMSARTDALVTALESELEPQPPDTDAADTDAPDFSDGLPVAHSSFVGRAAELAELAMVLPESRLLCLTGPGGVGKTRLAVEAVRRLPVRRSVTFVGLEAVRDNAALVAAVAAGLGVRDQPDTPTLALIDVALDAAPRLLIFDGAEHLRDEVASLVAHLLGAAPLLQVVVTTRRVLGVAGEVSWAVPPLACPGVAAPADAVLASDAVALFVTRARERLSGFDSARLAPHQLSELCRRLDGLPLAIELIAGWVGTLSVPDIVERNTALLSGRGRGTDSALDAVVRHSFDLLAPAEQELVPVLSAFAGRFTLEDARALTGFDDTDLAHRVRGLVDSSWLAVTPNGEHNRFAMLDTTRRFAAGRLADSGRSAAVAMRHAEHFAEVARASESGLAGTDVGGWTERLEAASADLELALWWCADETKTDLGLGLSASLWRWWLISGRMTVGRGWLRTFLTAARRRDDQAVARARSAAAVLAAENGDYRDAVTHALPALRTFDALGQRESAALAATVLGSAHRYLGERDLARRYFRRAMELRQAAGDQRGVSVAINNLALLALDNDDLVGAVRLFDEALVIKRRLGDPRSVAIGLANRSDVLIRLGRLTAAAASLDEALALAGRLNNLQLIATLRCNQGDLAASRQDWAAASEHYQAGVVAYREAGTHDVVVALVGLGRAAHRLGRTDEAAKHLREAESLVTETGNAQGLASVRAALAEIGETAGAALPDGITPRQADVLGLLATGASNKEIATALALKVSTVERHIATIYQKLELRGRVDATRYAIAHGLAAPR